MSIFYCLVGWMSEVQPRHHDFEGGPQQILGISCFTAHSPDLTPLLRCVTLPALCPHPEILQIQCGKAAKPRRNAHCPLIITPNGHSVWFSTAQLVYPMVYSIVYHIAAGWPLGKSLTVTSFIDRIGDGRASHPKLWNLGISNSNMDLPSKLLHARLKPRMSYVTSKTQKENDVSRSLSNRFK